MQKNMETKELGFMFRNHDHIERKITPTGYKININIYKSSIYALVDRYQSLFHKNVSNAFPQTHCRPCKDRV